jgi:adenine/guanine phosphoribosyltransferase-like PRPP-binding protein
MFTIEDVIKKSIENGNINNPINNSIPKTRVVENVNTFFNTSGSYKIIGNLRFVSCAEFMANIQKLIYRIPPNVDTIIGTARSGITAASFASLFLHLPILAFRQSKKDLVELGNGYRMRANKDGVVHAEGGKYPIVIDDTVMTGNSIKQCKSIIGDKYENIIFASVYCNPEAATKPDLWIEDLRHPHLLEWNLFNSMFSRNIAVDFDGVLCHDCSIEQDDDGEKYIDFIRNVKPKYLMRKSEIPLIVTARLEKYREETEKWLQRYNIRFKKLIMHPALTLKERNKDNIVNFKSKYILEWEKTVVNRNMWQFPIFVESNDFLASRIAEKTNVITVCTDSLKCYNYNTK